MQTILIVVALMYLVLVGFHALTGVLLFFNPEPSDMEVLMFPREKWDALEERRRNLGKRRLITAAYLIVFLVFICLFLKGSSDPSSKGVLMSLLN